MIKNIITGFLNKDKWLGYLPKTLGLKTAVSWYFVISLLK